MLSSSSSSDDDGIAVGVTRATSSASSDDGHRALQTEFSTQPNPISNGVSGNGQTSNGGSGGAGGGEVGRLSTNNLKSTDNGTTNNGDESDGVNIAKDPSNSSLPSSKSKASGVGTTVLGGSSSSGLSGTGTGTNSADSAVVRGVSPTILRREPLAPLRESRSFDEHNKVEGKSAGSRDSTSSSTPTTPYSKKGRNGVKAHALSDSDDSKSSASDGSRATTSSPKTQSSGVRAPNALPPLSKEPSPLGILSNDPRMQQSISEKLSKVSATRRRESLQSMHSAGGSSRNSSGRSIGRPPHDSRRSSVDVHGYGPGVRHDSNHSRRSSVDSFHARNPGRRPSPPRRPSLGAVSQYPPGEGSPRTVMSLSNQSSPSSPFLPTAGFGGKGGVGGGGRRRRSASSAGANTLARQSSSHSTLSPKTPTAVGGRQLPMRGHGHLGGPGLAGATSGVSSPLSRNASINGLTRQNSSAVSHSGLGLAAAGSSLSRQSSTNSRKGGLYHRPRAPQGPMLSPRSPIAAAVMDRLAVESRMYAPRYGGFVNSLSIKRAGEESDVKLVSYATTCEDVEGWVALDLTREPDGNKITYSIARDHRTLQSGLVPVLKAYKDTLVVNVHYDETAPPIPTSTSWKANGDPDRESPVPVAPQANGWCW